MFTGFAVAAAPLLCALAAVQAVQADSEQLDLPVCSTVNHDFNGNDILPRNPPPVSTGEDCCTKCANYTGCVAFSYMPTTGTCYLKSHTASQSQIIHQNGAKIWI